MRVLPWNQNQGLPLASSKQQEQQRESRRCCSFFCSWCASTGPDGSASASIKVDAFHRSSNSQRVDGSSLALAPPASLPISAPVGIARGEAANGKNAVVKVCLKSNLKKPRASAGTHNTDSPTGSSNRVNIGNDADVNRNRKREVQWTDAHGKELVEIREFELSDSSGSDDEDDGEANQGCACVIQ